MGGGVWKTLGVRGQVDPRLSMVMVSSSADEFIPSGHPIRRIRKIIDEVLAVMDGEFSAMYAAGGRPSVPPEALLKACVLMGLYSIRSERQFCERLNYDLLFKWFMDMAITQPAFDPTTFTKNKTRLLEHDIAARFFAVVVDQARLRNYVSSDHFSVDGTLLEAWASHKSFQPKDPPDDPAPASDPTAQTEGRNAEVNFHGHKRTNDTHQSTTDPEARLFRKSRNTAAKLCFAGHTLMENRNGLLVDMELTQADGYCERAAAMTMLKRLPDRARRRTVAADKAYQNAKEGAAAKIQPMDEAVLQLEQKVERGPHCRVVMRLDNNLSYEIVQIVPSFSAYRGNGTKHETVSVGFQSIRPGDTLQRTVEFTRIACADIVRVQVSDADRCQMGELSKYSPPNGQCLARLRVAPSTLMKFEK